MGRVLMHVPQWVGRIPMSRRGSLGRRAMSEGLGYDTDYFLGQEFLS